MTNLVTAREVAREISPLSIDDLKAWNDGETRIHDLRLAEALGFERPRKIREIVERNINEIETVGPSPRRGAMVVIGSGAKREVTEYWLNEPQALLVCMFSRTERAAEVRKQVIEAFMAWRRGKTRQTPPQAEYVPVMRLAQQIRVASSGAMAVCPTGDSARYQDLVEHIFNALRTAEQTRMMQFDVRQPDEVQFA